MSVNPGNVQAGSPASMDGVTRQRLAPGDGAHQPHQRRDMGVSPAEERGTAPPAGRPFALRIRICAESRAEGVSVSR